MDKLKGIEKYFSGKMFMHKYHNHQMIHVRIVKVENNYHANIFNLFYVGICDGLVIKDFYLPNDEDLSRRIHYLAKIYFNAQFNLINYEFKYDIIS